MLTSTSSSHSPINQTFVLLLSSLVFIKQPLAERTASACPTPTNMWLVWDFKSFKKTDWCCQFKFPQWGFLFSSVLFFSLSRHNVFHNLSSSVLYVCTFCCYSGEQSTDIFLLVSCVCSHQGWLEEIKTYSDFFLLTGCHCIHVCRGWFVQKESWVISRYKVLWYKISK